jgi:ABC-type multidrug transport system ATPase subunit
MTPVVELHGARKRFGEAVKGVDLAIAPGELVALRAYRREEREKLA